MVQIYHNPRCSKSRETLKLLQEKGIEPEIILYLETPPDVATIKALLKKLGKSPKEAMRTKEAEFKEQGLNSADVTDEQLIEAMANTPKLIERPIVANGNKAAHGRPPEQVLEIL